MNPVAGPGAALGGIPGHLASTRSCRSNASIAGGCALGSRVAHGPLGRNETEHLGLESALAAREQSLSAEHCEGPPPRGDLERAPPTSDVCGPSPPAPQRLLQAVLDLADLLGPVFPLRPRGKAPLFPAAHPGGHQCRGECGRTGHGFHDGTVDPGRIEAWWRCSPTANLGLVTGDRSGFDVLDVDPRHGGDATLAALEAEHGPLPPTLEVATGSGGRHLYFLHHEGLACAQGRPGRGLDVKADGGYVAAPPSVHPSGERYRWLSGRGPGEVGLAKWPSWLLALLAPLARTVVASPAHVRVREGGASRFGRSVLRRAVEAIQAAAEGEGHDTFRARARTVAGYVASGEIDLDLAYDALEAAGLSRGADPREVASTLAWAFADGLDRPLAPRSR